MKSESASLKKNLSMLQNIVPAEMADKISDLLIKIANDSLDNMDEHLKLRQKHNLGQIQAIDQRDRVSNNLKACFDLIKRKEDYYQFMHVRTLKE